MQDIIQIVLKSFPIVLLSEEKCPDVLERVLTLANPLGLRNVDFIAKTLFGFLLTTMFYCC